MQRRLPNGQPWPAQNVTTMNYNAQIKNQDVIANHEGATAYRMSAEMELYTAVVTTMLSDLNYEKADERVKRIAELVAKVDPVFVAQLAVYARTQMYMRSVPMLLLVELARVHKGDNLVARAIAKTISRADEISELLACYQLRNPQQGIKKLAKLSHQVQAGLQEAFNNFDEYQFAKYDRSSQVVRLRDALFLVHPKAKDAEQQTIFDKIASQTLDTPYTWETELSALGQQQFESEDAKKAAIAAKWEELIASGKLGYMAMLRNLRNIALSGASLQHINAVCARIKDQKAVLNSKQLPFRFLSAFREMSKVDSPHTPHILDSLEEAVLISAMNINGFNANDKVLLACDVSGSMQTAISQRSSVQNYDIGLLLAMLFQTTCNQVTAGMFGDIWKVTPLPTKAVLSNTLALHKREGEVGYSTNGYKVIDWMIENHASYDKVLIFTDCQMWDSRWGQDAAIQDSWHKYKAQYPQAKLYLFDLSGYGQAPFRQTEKDVFLIAGWSDKVFEMLDAIENGNIVLDKIKEIEL